MDDQYDEFGNFLGELSDGEGGLDDGFDDDGGLADEELDEMERRAAERDAGGDLNTGDEGAMEVDAVASTAVVLHEDKQYYPTAEEVYGQGALRARQRASAAMRLAAPRSAALGQGRRALGMCTVVRHCRHDRVHECSALHSLASGADQTRSVGSLAVGVSRSGANAAHLPILTSRLAALRALRAQARRRCTTTRTRRTSMCLFSRRRRKPRPPRLPQPRRRPPLRTTGPPRMRRTFRWCATPAFCAG